MSRGGVEVWVDATEEVIASEEIHSTTVMETTDTPIQKLLDTMVHEDGFFDDGFYCNECRSMFQHQHLTDPNAINGPSFILDSPTIMGGPQRALLSLPHGLMIARSSIPNAGLGVVNQGPTVSPGMHFGPYEGEMTSRLDAMGSEYAWEICRGKDKWEYIDGASEMHSNWMRYVNCARSDHEKNLLAVQYKDSVMFHCCRTIQQGDELLVWPSQTLLDHLSPAWNQIWFMKQTPTQTSASSGIGSHNFTCEQCQLPFTTETYLQRHTDYFHAPPPSLEEKKEVAATADDVSVVILNVEDHDVVGDDPANKGKLCADCGKTFKYDHHLARHQRCVHSNKRPYCCPLCRRSFSQASGLLRHQLVHKKVTSSVIRASGSGGGEQSHVVATVYQLDNNHHNTEHGGADDQPEVGGGGLDDDMENDGGDVVMEDYPDMEQQTAEESPAKKTRQKKIADNLCTECGKYFTHQGYLKKHKLTVHNGVRPYVCTVCRKSFGQHHDLARHLKAHNVKRSHKRIGFWCAPCILTFCTEDSLRHHTNLVHPEACHQEAVVVPPPPPEEEVGGEGDAVVIDAQDPDGNAVVPIAVIAFPQDADGALPDDAVPVAVPDDTEDNDEPVIDDDHGDDPDFVVDPSEAKEAEEAEEESLPKRRPQRLGARSKVAAITKRLAPKRKGGRKKKTKKGEEEEEEEEVEVEESTPKGKKPHKWYICDQCKTTYGSQKELKTHKCTAANTKHVCAQCGMEFKKSGFLKRHEKTVHKDGVGSSYSCDQCLKVFKKLSNLKSHQKSKRCERHHCTSELFPCDFCEFSFTLKSYLRKHLRRHHPVEFISSPHNETDEQPDDDPDNPHLCPHCGKTYVSTKHFKAHSCFQELRVVFLCTDCGKGFSNHYGLKQHQRIHTGEKPYKCPHCGKGFSYVGQLNVHIRTHTGEKPYLCTHCGESFRQSGDLKRHERKHTGVKPHNCPNCFKSFSRLQSLKAHQMLHLGQRKFKCTQCPRSFSRNYHLRRHHQKMHS